MLSGIRLTKDANTKNENRSQVLMWPSEPDDRYKRDLEEDLRSAFDFLIQFKKKLEVLHPQAVVVIEKLLQDN